MKSSPFEHTWMQGKPNEIGYEIYWNEYLVKNHSWKVVFLNIHECKASLMKLALKYNEMNILEHSWKVLFFNIHECIKPKIIKIYVINTWTKAMEN